MSFAAILFRRCHLVVACLFLSGVPVFAQSGDRLKDLVPPDFAIGGVLGGYDSDLQNSPLLDLIDDEFNAVTVKSFMPFGPWTNYPAAIDTSAHVNNVGWARSHGKRVHAHILVYPTENVRLPWFQNLDNSQVESTLSQYVATMAGSTSGEVWVWDVVNEIVGDNGDVMDADGLRIGLGSGDGFIAYKEYAAMGPGYIAKSFEWARAADPNAILIVNEYAVETVNDKSDRLLNYCIKLRDQGVPIDGVGFQNHWLDIRYEPNYDSIRENFQRFADAGFKIFITEMDIAAVHSRDNDPTPPTAAQLAQQRRVYTELLKIALDQPACKSLLMWDFTDESSWLQHTDFTLTLADRRPGFQDTVLLPGVSMFATPFSGGDGIVPITPKAAYFGMQETLAAHQGDIYRMTSGWDYRTSYLARYGVQSGDGAWQPGNGVYAETLDEESAGWASTLWRLEKAGTGIYRLHNQWANGVDTLTVQPAPNSGGQSPGNSLGLQSRDTNWLSQAWFFEPAGDGGFRLVNLWDPASGSLTREASGQDQSGQYLPGPELRTYSPQNWSSQIWYFDRIAK